QLRQARPGHDPQPPGRSPYEAPGQSPYAAARSPYDAPARPPYDQHPRSPYDPPEPSGTGWSPRRPDPRIGRPMRTGTLATGLAALVGLASLVPILAWGIVLIWSVAARTVDHAVTSLVLRRHEAGRRRSDVPVAVATSPWHLFVAALSTGLAMLLPLAFAVAATVIT